MALPTTLIVAYFAVIALLAIYGFHRSQLLFLLLKNRRRTPEPKERFVELPRVTVQLPLFNEMYVAERLLEAVLGLDYPKDRLEIQVLDDSTDETHALLEKRCQALVA